MSLLNELRTQAGVRTLLSNIDSNPKVAKNGKLGILTGVLHLAPGNMSGHEVCPKRSPGCTAACLHFAGSPVYAAVKNTARVARTQLLFRDRDLFMNILVLEMAAHLRAAERRHMQPAFRLNGTSDILWEIKRFNLLPAVATALGIPHRMFPTIIEMFPTIQFYDYTAIATRTPPPNYHLTFSLKEQNMNDARVAMAKGWNVAVVFEQALPAFFSIGSCPLPIINGDETDYRPSDPTPCIVGLKVKGIKGRADQSGFVQTQTPGDLLAA